MSEHSGHKTNATCRIAIIGGGPGGMMTAYQLQQRCSVPFETTIYEASPRLGGKIRTERFASAPVAYEAGAAELYDYSGTGEDPLRELIERLGLTVKPMSGASVVLDGHVLSGFDDVGRVYGDATRQALVDFDARAKDWMGPQGYYEADWVEANADPMTHLSFHDLLEQVPDENARRFLRTMVHSDVATEPHRTSAAYGLQNYLMNDARYMRLYTIEGGIERLPEELAAHVEARILLCEPVARVERVRDRLLRVTSRRAGSLIAEDYDFAVVALPNGYLSAIEWAGAGLAEAMHCHHVHYDHPAHYLRVSALFREAFWQDSLHESYLMLDAFGGCCLYDESSRYESRSKDCKSEGVLGWLLAGDAAMIAANHTDEELIAMVLDTVPEFLRSGPSFLRAGRDLRELFVEGRVHRWIGSVNGLPGGSTALDMDSRHIPQLSHPDLFVVGDYLFDSTLNGVLDSADYVAESLVEEIETGAHSEAAVSVSGTAR